MRKGLISYLGSIEIEAETENEALEKADKAGENGDIDNIEPQAQEIKE